jgi:hypothetical protein
MRSIKEKRPVTFRGVTGQADDKQTRRGGVHLMSKMYYNINRGVL